MAEPIWKDYLVDLGEPDTTGAGVPFSIYSDNKNETVFFGVAFPKPGAATAVVRINDICADYISRYFLEQEDPSMPAQPSFTIFIGDPVEGTMVDTVSFFADWSYDPLYNPATDGQNFPIVLTFAPGQYIPVTLYSGSLGTATIYTANGFSYTYTPTKARGGDFNNDFNLDFLRKMEYFGDSYVIPMADFPGAVRVEYKGRTWHLSKRCPQYALYYANKYGGWDALPVEGKTVQSDSLTRHSTEIGYINTRPDARGKMDHMVEIKCNFEFWTGWLTSQESARMDNLLNSPAVFVHDLESGLIRPLVLTNKTTEHKNFPGNLVAYKIEAELAQDRMRR